MPQRVTVGRFTRETNNVMHDVYVMPTGRTYYRRNMGHFEAEIPPGPGALVDLRRCVNDLKDRVVHQLQAKDMFDPPRVINSLADEYRCSYGTQFLNVDASAL